MSRINHTIALPMGMSVSLSNIAWIAWLMGIGLTIPFAHEVLFKSSFQIPGHHIEWMALVVIGRMTSKKPLAGTLTGATAGISSPLFYSVNPTTGLTYFAVGVVFDILFWLMKDPKGFLTVSAIAALAHLTKPVLRIVLEMMSGVPYRPLLISAWFPVATYLVFGFIGGLLGMAVVRTDERLLAIFRKKMNGV